MSESTSFPCTPCASITQHAATEENDGLLCVRCGTADRSAAALVILTWVSDYPFRREYQVSDSVCPSCTVMAILPSADGMLCTSCGWYQQTLFGSLDPDRRVVAIDLDARLALNVIPPTQRHDCDCCGRVTEHVRATTADDNWQCLSCLCTHVVPQG